MTSQRIVLTVRVEIEIWFVAGLYMHRKNVQATLVHISILSENLIRNRCSNIKILKAADLYFDSIQLHVSLVAHEFIFSVMA